jgi:hypothetical protein
MGTTTIIARVLTKFEKLENIVVPSLEIRAARAFALTALIDGDELIVVQF